MNEGPLEQAFAIAQFLFTEHAQQQMAKRELTEEEVLGILRNPETVLPVREGRVVAQAMLADYLVRVFVDVDRQPFEVVTAYRTSKIDRYRSRP
jgi:hypothetical protein